MPVIITKDNVDYYLVPAPLVNFSKQIYNNVGRPGIGADYTVSLQGTLMPTHGNPYYSSGVSGNKADWQTGGWATTYEVESDEFKAVSPQQLLDVTIRKQEAIRTLFTNPNVSGIAKPIKVTIRGWDEGSGVGSGLSFWGFVDEVSFDSESRWANPGGYNVNLRTSNFITAANSSFDNDGNEHLSESGKYAISNFTETYDVQEDGRVSINFNKSNAEYYVVDSVHKVYSINHSITAVGSPVYDVSGGYKDGLAPWQQAQKYINEYIGIGSGRLQPTNPTALSGLNHTAIDLFANGSGYQAANFIYQENIDREAGSYSITETFVLYPSGTHPVIETLTINNDISEAQQNTVNIQGNIQGLNTVSGFLHSGNAFNNAWAYFTGVVDATGQNSSYLAARGHLYNPEFPNQIHWLHPKPLSKSVATDIAAGTVSYTYSYDDRPPNVIPGSISESIQVNDTYPGELFSVTPVIGRSQPVLQYLNSRSEYKRNLSINIVMGKTGIPAWLTPGSASFMNVDVSGVFNGSDTDVKNSIRNLLFDSRPSAPGPSKDALTLIYDAVNPANETVYFTVVSGKCYHSAPTESWDARTRTYTYSVEWTYERTSNA